MLRHRCRVPSPATGPAPQVVVCLGLECPRADRARIRIRDIDCAFKVFRRDVFDRIQMQCVGAMVNTEIFAQAARFGMTVKEVQVNHFHDGTARPTGGNVAVIRKAFRELIRIRRKSHAITAVIRRVRRTSSGTEELRQISVEKELARNTSGGLLFNKIMKADVLIIGGPGRARCDDQSRSKRVPNEITSRDSGEGSALHRGHFPLSLEGSLFRRH